MPTKQTPAHPIERQILAALTVALFFSILYASCSFVVMRGKHQDAVALAEARANGDRTVRAESAKLVSSGAGKYVTASRVTGVVR